MLTFYFDSDRVFAADINSSYSLRQLGSGGEYAFTYSFDASEPLIGLMSRGDGDLITAISLLKYTQGCDPSLQQENDPDSTTEEPTPEEPTQEESSSEEPTTEPSEEPEPTPSDSEPTPEPTDPEPQEPE